jgi:RND superfamily putative drug exporter
VIDAASAFQSENEAPTVVVYERTSGVTPADLQAVTGQLQRFTAIKEVTNTPVGPIPSADGKAIQVVVPSTPAREAGRASARSSTRCATSPPRDHRA